jgi:hypothetical protein
MSCQQSADSSAQQVSKPKNKVTHTRGALKVRWFLASAHTGHTTTLPLSPGALLDVTMVQLVDLRGFNVVADVLAVLAQRAFDAEHESPVGPLWGKGRRWANPTGLVRRTRWGFIADAQERRWRAATGTLEAVTLGVNPRKRRDGSRKGDKAGACIVHRYTAVEQGRRKTGALLVEDIGNGMALVTRRVREQRLISSDPTGITVSSIETGDWVELAATVVIGEWVWGAWRQSWRGGCPTLVSVAVGARIPTASITLDDGYGCGRGYRVVDKPVAMKRRRHWGNSWRS